MRRMSALVVALALAISSAKAQANVEYVGGTTLLLRQGASARIDLSDDRYVAFYAGKQQMRIAYDRVNLLEYGQQVDRRLVLALVVSPVFLLSKTRKHFLTIGFEDEAGRQQAVVFRVDKGGIRAVLAALEARTGRRIAYQDQEARKAGN